MNSSARSKPRPMTAKDVMNPKLLSVREDLPVRELAAFLAEHQITGAPVQDRAGRFVGVVSTTDIAEAESSGPGEWHSGDPLTSVDRRGLHVEGADREVGDIMTPTVYTVPEHAPVSELAQTMIAGRVHRLLVTREGSVVGIVTSLDLLKLLCEREATATRGQGGARRSEA